MYILRELMDFDSFWTLWFWICHVVTWSLLSHFAMGVPFDMILEANREKKDNGPWSQATEALILAQVFRYTELGRRYGVVLSAASGFILATLMGFAIEAEFELARALASIMVPMTLVYILSLRTAFRIEALGLRGKPLRDAVRRQRLANQAVGLLAIITAVTLAIWEVLRRMQPWNL